jgi:hypothetical protein
VQAASLAAADSRALAWGAGGCSCTTSGDLKACSTMVHKGSGLISKIFRSPLPMPRSTFHSVAVGFPTPIALSAAAASLFRGMWQIGQAMSAGESAAVATW